MSHNASRDATSPFQVVHDGDETDVVVAGFSAFGLAGLTAVDYLADQLDLRERGHVTATGLATITPFEEGEPRNHTRLLSRDDLDLTVLVGELFVPPDRATAFGTTLFDWATEAGVSEVVVLRGVPVPHGPDDHRTYYIATEEYRERRLADREVPPMASGFLDGLSASLTERALVSPPDAGVFVTPVHAQAPDVDAALRLLETVVDVYGLDVDLEPLQNHSANLRQYYEDLADRLQRAPEAERQDDRMYM